MKKAIVYLLLLLSLLTAAGPALAEDASVPALLEGKKLSFLGSDVKRG